MKRSNEKIPESLLESNENSGNAEMSIPDKLRAVAELVVRTFRDELQVELRFDQAGVEWIDGYINRMRDSLPAKERPGLISTLGSYIGECIIRTYGGAWVEKDGMWGVQVNDRIWACPFATIQRQFENGPDDSVVAFFTFIPRFKRNLDKEPVADGKEVNKPVYYTFVRSNTSTLNDVNAVVNASNEYTIQPEPEILALDDGSSGSIRLVRESPRIANWPSALKEANLPEPAVSSTADDKEEQGDEEALIEEALAAWEQHVNELRASYGEQGFSEWLLALAPFLTTSFTIQAADFDNAGNFYRATQWVIKPGAKSVEVTKIERPEDTEDEGVTESE
jgi:hypothetical protein